MNRVAPGNIKRAAASGLKTRLDGQHAKISTLCLLLQKDASGQTGVPMQQQNHVGVRRDQLAKRVWIGPLSFEEIGFRGPAASAGLFR